MALVVEIEQKIKQKLIECHNDFCYNSPSCQGGLTKINVSKTSITSVKVLSRSPPSKFRNSNTFITLPFMPETKSVLNKNYGNVKLMNG